MKRLICILFSASMLIVSCTKEQPEAERQVPLNVSISFETKAGGSSSETVQPVVNSVRVLGFDANETGKPCVLNEFFPFGYTVTKSGSFYKVQMSSPIIINSQSTKYDFYVVLNEGDYSLVGQADGETVSDLLINIIPESSQESDFTDIYETLAKNDKTDISGNPVSEPAFLMCAEHLDFPISENEQKLPDAKEIEFIVPGGRTMAQIVIEKITSAPMTGYDTNEPAVPLVFVKSVSLENVPSTIDWAAPATTATGATAMASITVGEAVEDANGVYYQRIWPGYLYADVAVNAQVTQTTDARMYLGKKTGFLEIDEQEKELTKFEIKDWDKTDNKSAKNAYNLIEKADKFKPLFDNAADKNYFELEAENTKSFYSVTQVTQPSLSFGTDTGLTYTDDVWTVNLGEKYYVPENMTSDAEDATYIKVVLAVAAPSLDLSRVTDLDWWPSPGGMTRTTNYTCYMPYTGTGSTDGEIAIGSNNAASINDATAKLVAQQNMHIVYADDRDTEVDPDTEKEDLIGNMNVYFDGFYRKANGTSTITVNQNQKGGDFNWNIPDSDTDLYEFRIPVSQNGEDFSVRRNTRYKVTLHVNKDPRPSSSASSFRATKSAGYENPGITAIVETEKINDYED